MAWNAIWPDGSVSVRANTPTGQANTAFIKSSLNINHFFDDNTVGSNFDGNHRFVQMPKSAADVPLGASMDGVIYLKQASVTNTQIQGFYQNSNGIYQFIPTFLSGTVSISSSYNVVALNQIPAHSYGLIYMFKDNDGDNVAMGFFEAGAAITQTYCNTVLFQGSSTAGSNLKFSNGSDAVDLNIYAKTQSGSSGTYKYRIVYWAV